MKLSICGGQNMKTKVTNAIFLIGMLVCIPFVLGGCKKKVSIGEVLLELMQK